MSDEAMTEGPDPIERYVDRILNEWWQDARKRAFDPEHWEDRGRLWFQDAMEQGHADRRALVQDIKEDIKHKRASLVEWLRQYRKARGEVRSLEEAPSKQDIKLLLRRLAILRPIRRIARRGIAEDFLELPSEPADPVFPTERMRDHAEAIIETWEEHYNGIEEMADLQNAAGEAPVKGVQRCLRQADVAYEHGNPHDFVRAVEEALDADTRG